MDTDRQHRDDASRSLVMPLAAVGAGDLSVAGGKGANLGELIRAGFPVPNGFVVTTAAYATLLATTRLGEQLAMLLSRTSTAGAPDDGSAIRAAFSSAPMPDPVRAEIVAHYRNLGGGPVAVRSSATAEDLPGAAFAGQQDTYLDVAGDDALLEAVRNCWASLWTDRAIAYRRREGIDPHDVAIAVVVQDMVPADSAGVLFTANPVSGARDEVVIDAGRGLGEALVSGLVTPDHYVVDRHGLRERASGGAGSGAGTTPVLTAQQVSELADLGRRAAAHFGVPQDLEWAISGDRVHLLQARPMTALPPDPTGQPAPLHPNIFQRKMGPFFLEMFQQRPYPLDVDGWLKHVIIAMLHRMAGSVGVVFPSLSALLPEVDGVVVRLVPPVPHPTLTTLGAPVSVARRVRRYQPASWTEDSRFLAFRAAAERIKSQDVASLDWAGLLAQARRIFAVTGSIADLRISYLPASFIPQVPLRLMLVALGKSELASTLLAGAETRTEQANRALERLAEFVKLDAALVEAFDELEPRDLVDRLSTDPRFADFAARFRVFLAEYGHRETVSLVLSSSPTWADAPEVVLGLVRSLLTARPERKDAAGMALAELMAHPALRNPWLRKQALASVAGSRIGTAFRDDSHFYVTFLLPALRKVYAELGERLRSAGVIPRAADVYHLRFEELSGMTNPAGLGAGDKDRYGRLVASRAARRAELDGVPLLAMSTLPSHRRGDETAIVTGMGASRGVATGRVRIIRDASGFGTLRSGEVLVCAYTNPAWTPLFQRAAAVVVDTGGMGSHAAIVAREYGIPAVMGTGDGTTRFIDGQLVTVDGTAGRVTEARA